MSLVSFTRIQGNSTNSLKQAILESLDLIDYSFRKEIKNVVIKPNLCYYWDYSTGLTTDPLFVATLAQLIREQTSSHVNISVVESDASAMRCKHVFKILGYEKMAKKYGLSLINLSEEKAINVKVKSGSHTFQFNLPQIIQDADLRINVPKLKYTSHPLQITCALKNIFGCNPYKRKSKYHKIIAETIVALNKIMKFDLVVADGNIVGNIGFGTRKMGLIMASRDPVAIDVATAKILGVNPNSIKYVMLASKEGVGNASFVPKGARLELFKASYPRIDAKFGIMTKMYKLIGFVKGNR